MSMHYGNTSTDPTYTKADPSTRNGGGAKTATMDPTENLERGKDQEKIDCPVCGSPVGNLPDHIHGKNCNPDSNSESDQ
jgi:hypothetical protein